MKTCDVCRVETAASMTLPAVATLCLGCYGEWLEAPENGHTKMTTAARLMDFVNRKRAEQLNAQPLDVQKPG